MTERKINKLLIQAEENFADSDYSGAMEIYAKILAYAPDQREARVGVLMCDVAMDHEEEAQALYDYYKVIKKEGNQDAEERMEELMKSFDGSMEKISEYMNDSAQAKINTIDGINYHDFKNMVELRGGFKRAFEDIMFSTKIVISRQDDFLEFMDNLVDNGYQDIALVYLENAGETFTHDRRIQQIVNKLNQYIENSH